MKKYWNNRGGSILIVIVLLLFLTITVASLYASTVARSKNNQDERASLQIYYTAQSITMAVTDKIKNRELDTVKSWEDTATEAFQQASEKYRKPSWRDEKYRVSMSQQTTAELQDSYIQDVEEWRKNFVSYVKEKVRASNEAEFRNENPGGTIRTLGTIAMDYRHGENLPRISTFEEAKALVITPQMIFSGMEIRIETTAYGNDGDAYTMSAIMESKKDAIASAGGDAGNYQFLAQGDIIIDGLEGTGSTVEGNIMSQEGNISLDRIDARGTVLSEEGNINYNYSGIWTGNNLFLDMVLRAKKDTNIFLTNGQILTANFDVHAGRDISLGGDGGNEFGGTYKTGRNFSFIAPKTFYGTVEANGSVELAGLDFYGSVQCSKDLILGNRQYSTRIEGPLIFGGELKETDVRYSGEVPAPTENFKAGVSQMTETSLSLEEGKPSWVDYMLKQKGETVTLEEFNKLCRSGSIDTTKGDRFFTVIYSNREKELKYDVKIKGNNRVFLNLQPGKHSEDAFVTVGSRVTLGGSSDNGIVAGSCPLFLYSDRLAELHIKEKVDLNAQFYLPTADFIAEGKGSRNQFNGRLCAKSILIGGYQFSMASPSEGSPVWSIRYEEGGLGE